MIAQPIVTDQARLPTLETGDGLRLVLHDGTLFVNKFDLKLIGLTVGVNNKVAAGETNGRRLENAGSFRILLDHGDEAVGGELP